MLLRGTVSCVRFKKHLIITACFMFARANSNAENELMTKHPKRVSSSIVRPALPYCLKLAVDVDLALLLIH